MQKTFSARIIPEIQKTQSQSLASQHVYLRAHLFCVLLGIVIVLWNLEVLKISKSKPVLAEQTQPVVRNMQQQVIDFEQELVDHDMQKNISSNVQGWFSKDGGHYQCIKPKRYARGQIESGRQQVQQRLGCQQVDPEQVQILGVVAAHHKAGTVFRRGFYYTVCALTNTNFASIETSQIIGPHNTTLLTWDGSFSEDSCMDFHPCNKKGIIHAKMDVRDTCEGLGVVCEDWFDLKCFMKECKDLIELDANLKLINPVRNPFSMVTSAYKYHKGHSPEAWANEKTLQEIGLWHTDEGMEYLLSETLSNALSIYSLEIGLELAYRVMSNDIFDMSMLYKLSANYTNIMTSRFEDCSKNFDLAMQRELEFFDFYEQNATYSDKRNINQVGLWVQEEGNLAQQKESKHITSDNSIQLELDAALLTHPRFEQLDYMAQIMGYEIPNQKLTL